jgi:hypothetical protein
VCDADNSLDRIMEKDGNAVGESQKESDFRAIRQDNIGLRRQIRERPWSVGAQDFGTMHEPGIKDGGFRAVKDSEGARPVLAHTGRVVSDHRTDI